MIWPSNFLRLSSANFTWSILEYFAPYMIFNNNFKPNLADKKHAQSYKIKHQNNMLNVLNLFKVNNKVATAMSMNFILVSLLLTLNIFRTAFVTLEISLAVWMFPFYTPPLKTPENLWFFYVFRVYKMRRLARNGSNLKLHFSQEV